MQLSKNFSAAEFCKSATAVRNNIDNYLPRELVDEARITAVTICQRVRDHYGVPFVINSGYRCPALNALLGSSDKSQHTQARAVDIEVPGVSNYDLAVWVSENIQFDQLILEFYEPHDPTSGWVHVSQTILDGSMRGDLLTYTRDKRWIKGLVSAQSTL